MLRLKEKYKKEVIPAMREKFSYTNNMAVPKIKKVVVNCGFGRMITGKTSKEREKIQEHIFNNLALITGQRPGPREAKKSISSFHLKKGMKVAAQVSLRGKRMYDFLERLIWLVLPRTRDFKGISAEQFDSRGNLTIGFKEYTPFPEVTPEKEKGIFGLEVTVVTSAKNKEEGMELLKLLGFPIRVQE
ncbi:50S ribosomal protein L5 [Patescibacteria group bacterium]|nr:50S ribosomal protein L5 [Patescibacteria group bacterium]